MNDTKERVVEMRRFNSIIASEEEERRKRRRREDEFIEMSKRCVSSE